MFTLDPPDAQTIALGSANEQVKRLNTQLRLQPPAAWNERPKIKTHRRSARFTCWCLGCEIDSDSP